ncbi:MAG TPA: peptidylprolyl isomerase [Saprospiraceae bacterium]|nr:peptidylprolyl isomerase [Saprospiraceae bacterium]
MALISEIRKKSWLLIILIALGMGGFVAMDMVNKASKSSGDQYTLGSVNGNKIDWQDFQRAERILYPNSTEDIYGQRNYIWNYMVEEQLVNEEAEELGLNIGDEEMEDLQYGNRLSPIIQRNFRDPNTGQIDRQNLDQIKANLGTGKLQPQLEEFWAFQKGEIKKDRLQRKLIGIVKKGIYTPTWLAQQLQNEQGSSIDAKYVAIPLDKIDSTEVVLTDEDYKNFMKENEGLLKRKEEFRTVDFIVFNVTPTTEDTAVVREAITQRVTPFQETDNDSLFVENNFGTIDVVYYKKDDLSEAIADTIFDLPVGSVYGPYIDGSEFRVAKVLDKKIIPDSVKSRHILIQAKSEAEIASAYKIIDSLKTVIESGQGKFDSLALQFSQDGSRDKGGDLGYSAAGRMVKPFNDLLFYEAEPGEVNIVTTQFGVHLVEVTDRKFIDKEQGVKLAYLVEPIVPSEETQERIYDDALEFSGNHRTTEELKKSIAEKPELSIETAQGLTANSYQFSTLGSGGVSREIIRWAFEPSTKPGMVAPEVYIYDEPTLFYNAHYVIPALKSVIKSGISTLADVKENFADQVMNKKRAEMLAAKITSKDLDAIAAQFDVKVDTLDNVNFNMSYLPVLGNETTLIGRISVLPKGEVSGPIVGKNGVYVVEVISRTEASLSTDIAAFRGQVSNTARGSVDTRLMEAVKAAAKLKDNRYTFY